MNKDVQNEITTSEQSDISTLRSSHKSVDTNNKNMDRAKFFHWWAAREVMEFIRSRNNSPETRRLVEQRERAISTGYSETPI